MYINENNNHLLKTCMNVSVMKLLCIFLACVAVSNANGIGRIVGGTATDITKIPYQLGLSVDNTFKCGAVIISTQVALTSAQCVYGITPSKITVRAGSSYMTTMGTVHTVSSVVIHPSFSPTTYDYDIAILKFTKNFVLGTTIGAVALPSVGQTVAVGSPATVSGWGITTIGGTTLSGNLQVVTVPVIANSVCSAALSRINKVTDRMLCAGYTTGGADVCTGDNGGPLVYAGKLIGLASWGAACGAVGSPGVYTRVAAVRSWINDQTGV